MAVVRLQDREHRKERLGVKDVAPAGRLLFEVRSPRRIAWVWLDPVWGNVLPPWLGQQQG
jgi:hypothetical protein